MSCVKTPCEICRHLTGPDWKPCSKKNKKMTKFEIDLKEKKARSVVTYENTKKKQGMLFPVYVYEKEPKTIDEVQYLLTTVGM